MKILKIDDQEFEIDVFNIVRDIGSQHWRIEIGNSLEEIYLDLHPLNLESTEALTNLVGKEFDNEPAAYFRYYEKGDSYILGSLKLRFYQNEKSLAIIEGSGKIMLEDDGSDQIMFYFTVSL